HDNVYHQWEGTSGSDKSSKFNTVAALNDLWKNKWGSLLMSFNDVNTHSYIYRDSTERVNLFIDSYFNEILTYSPQITDYWEEPTNQPDSNQYRYIQAATFKNTNESHTQYFMIVNRRCSPYRPEISEDGGRRFVKVKFDANSNAFSEFNNWRVINIENNSTVAVFDKRVVSTLDLGWYLPGEGKLYKIIPM
ncbi:MAG TPA: hypothetical protein VGK25_02710, partial [Ignavibacteria bacterium]